MDGTFSDGGAGAVLGFADAPGLADLVYGDNQMLADLVQPTSWDNVSILPAGRHNCYSPIDLVRVVSLYQQSRNQFDCILIQQGAIVEDTRYLPFAAKADLVLLMADEGVTLVNDLDRCREMFRNHQISNVRLVLCDARQSWGSR
jgi:septum formation inhibitor-activating ATPase MinD